MSYFYIIFDILDLTLQFVSINIILGWVGSFCPRPGKYLTNNFGLLSKTRDPLWTEELEGHPRRDLSRSRGSKSLKNFKSHTK